MILREPSGYIAHPGFPGPVTQFKTCYWQVNYVDSTKRPNLSFKMLGLKADPGKCYESHVRYNLGKDLEPACGCAGLPDNQKSTSNNAYIQFKARLESGVGQPGFLTYYKDIGRFAYTIIAPMKLS